MTDSPIDEPMLAALVDGELSGEEAARIEAATATDPELAARLQRARDLRSAVAAAYDSVLAEPLPAHLRQAARGGGQLVDLAEARSLRRGGLLTRRLGPGLAFAAAVAAAFAVGRLTLPPAASPIVAAPGGLVAQGTLATALQDQLAAAQRPDAPVKIGVSFQASDGAYCRTFTLRRGAPVAGLACREPAGWRVRMAVEAPPAAASAYRLAGDETPAAVLEAVDAAIRGAPFDAAGEARAKAAGWRAAR